MDKLLTKRLCWIVGIWFAFQFVIVPCFVLGHMAYEDVHTEKREVVLGGKDRTVAIKRDKKQIVINDGFAMSQTLIETDGKILNSIKIPGNQFRGAGGGVKEATTEEVALYQEIFP